MKFIPIISLAILLLFSCKKGAGNFTLKGKISDLTFNSGLDSAELKLYKVPVGSPTEILIETVILGADGTYSFEFPRERMEKYIIRVSKNNYFLIDETIYYSDLSLENDNVRNYSTSAKSWVELRILNANPVFSDQLRYTKQEGYQDCEECCPSSEQIYFGALDTSIFCINKGNTTYSIYYNVIGANNQGIKQVTTVPFDTTQIYLSY
ncbi:MAG: hypothetical protein EBQ94_07440 [Flavobacteriales bacterium]|nr:hypothetical protein [Crocinitomicaceae bacterium]NBX80197.1 hypothetical protein [Flavobacteriales bacterium]NCA21209.1 hypothetical protein [Crocinitomicaceae bacterium]